MAERDGWATVPHERGEAQTVARALLDQADNPRDVVYLAGQNAFSVPDAVAESYRKSVTTPRRRAPKKETE